jgi:hypothetical protein
MTPYSVDTSALSHHNEMNHIDVDERKRIEQVGNQMYIIEDLRLDLESV